MVDLNKDNIALGLVIWNGERFLSKLLEGIFNQTHKDFTLYVLDNRSTDKTHEILNFWKLKDSRIKVFIDHRQRGFVEAQKLMFVDYLSKHQYCCFVCDDDLYDSSFLKENITNIIDCKLDLSYSNYRFVDETGTRFFPGPNRSIYLDKPFNNCVKFLLFRNCIPLFFGIYRTQSLLNSMNFFKIFDNYGYDHENLMLFHFLTYNKIGFIDKYLFSYRLKDRELLYLERGYAEASGLLYNLYRDIIHNYHFISICIFNFLKNRRFETLKILCLLSVCIISFLKYTIFKFFRKIITMF